MDRLREAATIDLAKVGLPALQLPALPSISLPSVDLSGLDRVDPRTLLAMHRPNADDLMLGLVRVMDGVQDAVMTAPLQVHAVVVDLRAGVSNSVSLVRETVGI